ncbi:hypothetical protein V1478_018214 [Vespula squamosa]|uniref:Uncharacterized protein n=1 Tax=Vespula squamosa TaxID=30214 RepID=A0ABD1ZUD6_VESSQ
MLRLIFIKTEYKKHQLCFAMRARVLYEFFHISLNIYDINYILFHNQNVWYRINFGLITYYSYNATKSNM